MTSSPYLSGKAQVKKSGLDQYHHHLLPQRRHWDLGRRLISNQRSVLKIGVESFSIIFSHRSFQKPIAISAAAFSGCLERRIPAKNGEVTPRSLGVQKAIPVFKRSCFSWQAASMRHPKKGGRVLVCPHVVNDRAMEPQASWASTRKRWPFVGDNPRHMLKPRDRCRLT